LDQVPLLAPFQESSLLKTARVIFPRLPWWSRFASPVMSYDLLANMVFPSPIFSFARVLHVMLVILHGVSTIIFFYIYEHGNG
jgi:hypothetical protein